MCKIFIILIMIVNNSNIASASQVCILIHGTWGLQSDWHTPGHPFYEILNRNLAEQQIKLVSFTWCGTLSYEKRKIAGLNLAKLIDSYEPSTNLIIIAHSHGGNVGIIASQYLQEHHKISHFYALGTPFDDVNYQPNLQVIQNFYNIFSFGDLYQTALGMHQRVLPLKAGIYNINIEINHQKPTHEDLHSPMIATWLLKLPTYLKKVSCNHQLFAQFYDHHAPDISIEKSFEAKQNQDLNLHGQIHNNLVDFTNGRCYCTCTDIQN